MKTFHCEFCDHVSADRSHLQEHVRVVHTHRNVKPYKCAYCEFHCATSGNCRKHCKAKHRDLPVQVIKVSEKYPKGSCSILGRDLKSEEQMREYSNTDTKNETSSLPDSDGQVLRGTMIPTHANQASVSTAEALPSGSHFNTLLPTTESVLSTTSDGNIGNRNSSTDSMKECYLILPASTTETNTVTTADALPFTEQSIDSAILQALNSQNFTALYMVPPANSDGQSLLPMLQTEEEVQTLCEQTEVILNTNMVEQEIHASTDSGCAHSES